MLHVENNVGHNVQIYNDVTCMIMAWKEHLDCL